MKIDFVISVRNRDNKRIQRCVDSLRSDITGEIYVVDYGSDIPIKVNNCKVLRINTDNIWNKSHALNIGIKQCKNDFIGTVDCDMVLKPTIFDKLKVVLNEWSFIYTKNVRRVLPEVFDWGLTFEQIEKISTPWFQNKKNNDDLAVGGIQIFSKRWIYTVKGYDENFAYWGGMDNDIYYRAIRTGLVLVDINELILHQEHQNKKEENLVSLEEREVAYNRRSIYRMYLDYKEKNSMNVGNKIWGEIDNPQQDGIKVKMVKDG